jgi:hypothetical protein
MTSSLYEMRELLLRTAAPIKLKATADIGAALRSLDAFLTKYSIDVHPMLDPLDELGESVPMSDPEDRTSLDNDHRLSLRLHFFASAGDPVEAIAPALLEVMADHGTLELITIGAPIDDAVQPIFIGPTEEARYEARVEYALRQAAKWLEPHAPAGRLPSSLAQIVTHAAKSSALDDLLAELTEAGINDPDREVNGGDCVDLVGNIHRRLTALFGR